MVGKAINYSYTVQLQYTDLKYKSVNELYRLLDGGVLEVPEIDLKLRTLL